MPGSPDAISTEVGFEGRDLSASVDSTLWPWLMGLQIRLNVVVSLCFPSHYHLSYSFFCSQGPGN